MSLCELPSEIILKIFSFVQAESVFVLPRVCRRWRVICSTLAVQEIKWKHYPMKIEEFVVMLSKFGRIESLNFDLGDEKNSDQVDDLIVIELAKKYSGLKSLDLSGSYDFPMKITDSGISKIGEGCPQLKSLDLSFCRKVTDIGITKIAEGCPQLQELDLISCTEVTDDGITKIGEGCPQLQKLKLSHCTEVTDVGITKIGEGCLQLQQLNLDSCTQVTEVGISNITNACKIKKNIL